MQATEVQVFQPFAPGSVAIPAPCCACCPLQLPQAMFMHEAFLDNDALVGVAAQVAVPKSLF